VIIDLGSIPKQFTCSCQSTIPPWKTSGWLQTFSTDKITWVSITQFSELHI